MTETLISPTPKEFLSAIMDYHHASLLAEQTGGQVQVDNITHPLPWISVVWGDVIFNPRSGTLEDSSGTLVDVKKGRVRIETYGVIFTRGHNTHPKLQEVEAARLVDGKIQIPAT